MRWLVAIVCLFPASLGAVECGSLSHKGASYTICEVAPASEDLRLFLNDPDSGAPLGSFENVDALLSREGARLGFAMNAGMYHSDRSPVGQYVENGVEQSRIITSKGPGNFGLLPNGVFCIRDGRADVMETGAYLGAAPACRYATQSGPMLVIDGMLHPRFLRDSDSTYIRNGVGTSADGARAVFVMSDEAVNFHAFATVFRDVLKLPQALYLDGNISRLYAPGVGRFDLGFPMGPIVGVVEPPAKGD